MAAYVIAACVMLSNSNNGSDIRSSRSLSGRSLSGRSLSGSRSLSSRSLSSRSLSSSRRRRNRFDGASSSLQCLRLRKMMLELRGGAGGPAAGNDGNDDATNAQSQTQHTRTNTGTAASNNPRFRQQRTRQQQHQHHQRKQHQQGRNNNHGDLKVCSMCGNTSYQRCYIPARLLLT